MGKLWQRVTFGHGAFAMAFSGDSLGAALQTAGLPQSEEMTGATKSTLAADPGAGKIWRRQYRPTRCYLRVSITFESSSVPPLNLAGFEAVVADALQGNFGICGAAQCKWNIVGFDEAS